MKTMISKGLYISKVLAQSASFSEAFQSKKETI